MRVLLVITGSVGYVLLAGTTAVEAFDAAELALGCTLFFSVRRRRMRDTMIRVTEHYLVCTHGRLGRQIIRALDARGGQFVVVDCNQNLEEPLLEKGLPHITGGATHDEVLLDAGVQRARGSCSKSAASPGGWRRER